MTIKDVLRTAIDNHSEDELGSVTNPEKLLDLQIAALTQWLLTEQRSYQEGMGWQAAAALGDIIRNQMQ